MDGLCISTAVSELAQRESADSQTDAEVKGGGPTSVQPCHWISFLNL
jgi:hypothetical protein